MHNILVWNCFVRIEIVVRLEHDDDDDDDDDVC